MQQFVIIASRFNEAVVEKLLCGALKAFKDNGIPDNAIEIIRVPGAFEIPLVLKRALQTERFSGAVVLGAVIRGETAHFDYLASPVANRISELMLAFDCPIGFGLLTTENGEQAFARAGGAKGNKGEEAANAMLCVI